MLRVIWCRWRACRATFAFRPRFFRTSRCVASTQPTRQSPFMNSVSRIMFQPPVHHATAPASDRFKRAATVKFCEYYFGSSGERERVETPMRPLVFPRVYQVTRTPANAIRGAEVYVTPVASLNVSTRASPRLFICRKNSVCTVKA